MACRLLKREPVKHLYEKLGFHQIFSRKQQAKQDFSQILFKSWLRRNEEALANEMEAYGNIK